MEWDGSIAQFKQYLRFERGLATNTIDAYLTDVSKLQQFAELNGYEFQQVGSGEIQEFLVWINEHGVSIPSQARILSGLKAFYNFLEIETDRHPNPVALIQSPRLERKL